MTTPEQAINILQPHVAFNIILGDRFTDGESGAGAYLVSDGQGNRYSLKLYDYPEAAQDVPQVQIYLNQLKQRQYPAPQIIAVVTQNDSTATLQEFVCGNHLEPLDPTYIPHITALVTLQKNFTPTPSDWPKRLIDTLLVGGKDYCVHQSLDNFSVDTKNILEQLKLIGKSSNKVPCNKTDLVHFDFHGGNIFVDHGQISGIIDWDGACIGDRMFDLTTLVYYYYQDLKIREPIEMEILDNIPIDTLRLYYAHMILRQLDWSIRHHAPNDVAKYLAISQQILQDYA